MELDNPRMELALKRQEFNIVDKIHLCKFSQIWRVNKKNTCFAAKIISNRDKRDIRERDILVQLTPHDNILHFQEMITTIDDSALILEYCSGGNLNDFVVRQSVEPAIRVSFIRDIRRAIQYIHGRGIVHLNIQPSKFLLTYDSRNNKRLKLCDFSHARSIAQEEADNNDEGFDENETNTFGPPQQRGQTPLEAIDVYSGLGAVPYALYSRNIKGRHVVAEHEGRPLREVEEVELGRNVKRLVNDRDLRELITDALAKDPNIRLNARDADVSIQSEPANPQKSTLDGLKRNAIYSVTAIFILAIGFFFGKKCK